MQIRNIHDFRINWKKEQGYNMPKWDEHFIGSTHGQVSGFYKMVNGIVGNVRADLTPKLQNAQDEQAIYEFLQNAADSGATECAVIYDSEYFMVINNGTPFSEKDVKAILNTFQGTKADKSKTENCGKIGRYGIGFKLAYRLLGKSDGVNELLNDLAGPIIYSWNKPNQFEELSHHKVVQTTDNVDAPWLFKILLACFPIAPKELVRNLDYKKEALFKVADMTALKRFIKKHEELISQLDLGQGSLFFLKFGPKKHHKLHASLMNLRSGVGYALNTLKTLNKVILQDEIVEKYPTHFETYSIQPQTTSFKKIDPEFPQCPIELKVGFPTNLKQTVELKRSPSIYQFFPMRNEQHNLAFFIHGTSFAKITDRTRLDDQGEANKESLKYITSSLIKDLDKYQSEDFERYTHIYRSLLLSDEPDKYNSTLVTKYLYEPLLEYIKSRIPTNKENIYDKELVILKDTKLPIEPIAFGIGKEWFYWSEEEIAKEASNKQKLSLKRWSLKELLLEGNLNLINSQIQKFTNKSYDIFIKELKDVRFDAAFLEKFHSVKFLKFTSQDKQQSFLSINDLKEDDNTFLITESTKDYKNAIEALGFSTLVFETSKYPAIVNRLERALPYLYKPKAMYEKISSRTAKNDLSPNQKQHLFQFLSTLVDKKTLLNLELFANKDGEVQPLKGLIAQNLEIPTWLESFKIKEEEEAEELHQYCISSFEDGWYEHIIYPNWDALHAMVEDPVELYEQVIISYASKDFLKTLTTKEYIYIDDQFGYMKAEDVFFHKELKEIENYEELANAMVKLTELHLPHPSILHFLEQDPLKTLPTTNTSTWKSILRELNGHLDSTGLTSEEKQALFRLFEKTVAPSELVKIKLFSNQNNEPSTLKSMLKPSSTYPDWLAKYQIEEELYHDDFEMFMVSPNKIYSEIIYPNWSTIIQDESIHDSPSSFYETVIKYADLSNGTKALNILEYIYVDEEYGFANRKDIFYDEKLSNQLNYYALTEAIQSLTGLLLPEEEVLPYLSHPIFKTNNTKLRKTYKANSVTLDEGAVTALLDFSNEVDEDLFTFLVIEESENPHEYILDKKGSKVQFFLDNDSEEVRDTVNKVLGEQYKALPTRLFKTDYHQKGIIQGKELYNKLSKVKDTEVLSTFVQQSENVELQEQAINKIDKIVLEEGKLYNENSFEHRILQIFRNEEANVEGIRDKIYIRDLKGNKWKLTDIGYKDEVKMVSGDDVTIIPLSKILPIYKEHQSLLNRLSAQFPDYEAPSLLERSVFYAEGQLSLKDIHARLRKEYLELESAEQLAFLLLYCKQTEDNRLLKDFSINTIDGDIKLLEYRLFQLNDTEFVNSSVILEMDQYEGLPELLGMTGELSSFDCNGITIITEPHFEENEFYLPNTRSTDEDEDISDVQLEIMHFLYNQWKNKKIDKIVIVNEEEDGNIIDFEPGKYVYPREYALNNERLPHWVEDWLDEVDGESKIDFLTALGVHTFESILVQSRLYFKADKEENIDESYLAKLNGESANTLRWLYEQNVEIKGEEKRNWMKELYAHIPAITSNTPIPYISSIEQGEIVYHLDLRGAYDLYFLSEEKIESMEEEHKTPLELILSVLEERGARLTNIILKGVSLPTSQPEAILNIQLLEADSEEWQASHYMKWKEQGNFMISLYNGQMPYQLRIFDTIVNEYASGDAVQVDEVIFLNSNVPILEETLFNITNTKLQLTDSHLLTLLRYKNEDSLPLSSKEPSKDKVRVIPNPETKTLEKYINKGVGELELNISLKDLPVDVIEQLKNIMDYATKSKIKILRSKPNIIEQVE